MDKFFRCLICVIFLVSFCVSTSIAGPYLSANLGAVGLNDSDITGGPIGFEEISFDRGIVASAALGYSHYEYRGELEFSYRSNDIDETTFAGVSSNSRRDSNSYSLMVNGYYDFFPGSTVSPFIGAGIGYSNVEADVENLGRRDDHVFAYQGSVGTSFNVNESLNIDLQYRLFMTNDADLSIYEMEYFTHNVSLGLRLGF